MKTYITKSSKPEHVTTLTNEALDILDSVGIPIDKTERGLERMAICFMAVAGVKKAWEEARLDMRLRSRDVINYVNEHFSETISSGSYDDIRRKDLKYLVLSGLVINSGAAGVAATNNPTRSYSLHPDFQKLILTYGTPAWDSTLEKFRQDRPMLVEQLARKREFEKIPVTLPNGKPIDLSLGEHNVLQKAIIEEFLPRFGSDCEVLYIGDTSDKDLFKDEEELKKLNFFELGHEELPDIIAYSKDKNWLYMIEAVHSSGPMSEIRVKALKDSLSKCTAELIFVTTFLKMSDFRKWTLDIAWETEVWIAEKPDHMVHFNGDKFLGPYKPS